MSIDETTAHDEHVQLRFDQHGVPIANTVNEPDQTAAWSPSLSDDEKRGTDILKAEQAEKILAHRNKYDYASRKHVEIRVLWAVGMRMGALRAIDLDDVHLNNQFIELSHRPVTETPLKNNVRGEREVALTPQQHRFSATISTKTGSTRRTNTVATHS